MKTSEYEGMFVLKIMSSETDQKNLTEQVDAMIRSVGANIDLTESLGRRRLAFPIKKHEEGYYHVVRFRADTSNVRELNRSFQLHEQMIRFMILAVENYPKAGIEALSERR